MPTTTEERRVAALAGYGVLDTPNEVEFDHIVRQAASLLSSPISLVDEHRQWFKAKVGLEANETPRSISFCTHAIRGSDVFVAEDAGLDGRFSDTRWSRAIPTFVSMPACRSKRPRASASAPCASSIVSPIPLSVGTKPRNLPRWRTKR